MRRFGVALATVGGAGYFPFAPGTVGSAIGVLLYLATRSWPLVWQAFLIVAVSVAGTWAGTVAERHFGREDPGPVVIDEVAGQLVTFFATGIGHLGVVAGFLIFRVFDIVKPWPARRFERFPGGAGIMADDLMVGVYANLLLRIGMALLQVAPVMRELASAEILAVGSELLTPHRTDTNSLYLTARLNEVGLIVRAKAIVGDNAGDLQAIFAQALARAEVVVLTGGLGPTADDITREAVASALNLPLQEDAEVLAAIQQRFESRGVPMPAINRRQAQVPRGARVLKNPNGTAPGLWIETDGRIVVLLPGPPRELQAMFEASVQPGLAERTGGRGVRRRVLKMTGRPESQVEEIAEPVYHGMAAWPIPVQTTILAAPGQIELHLSARGSDGSAIDRALDNAVQQLTTALGEIVFSTDGRQLAEVVGDLLRARGGRIAVAESCTGGMVLARLTDVPGSSAWVVGGVMAYANEVKVEQLDVSADLIAAHGAVSEPVAIAMAEGVRERLHADLGVSVTGIAGPSGGTSEKPVGTVAIAVSTAAHRADTVRTFKFIGDRQMIRLQATQAALEMMRRAVQVA